MGLGHSGEDGPYHDQTGLMGFSYARDEGTEKAKLCFNPAKSWQLQWYSGRYVEIDAEANNWQGQIVGVGNTDKKSQEKRKKS